MIEIDGSFGEGGGQILRTALALAMCTGQPFRITAIRARRRRPGLLRQHLTAVEAARTVCGATVTGAEVSSQTLEFVPGPVTAGDYRFAVGTAGSATLVLQTVLPPLLVADRPSTLVLEGGTHNPLAPPWHFLAQAYFPTLAHLGATCTSELTSWGFVPAGGGRFEVRVTPAPGGLRPFELGERGDLRRAEVLAAVSQVPWEVADDEAKLIVKACAFPVGKARAEQVPSPGPGNVAMLALEFAHARAVFTGFGQIGVSRRKVAHDVTATANGFVKTGAAVEEHLADQLLVPLALAGGGRFTTVEPSSHTTTNAEVIRRFLPVEIACRDRGGGLWDITVNPSGGPCQPEGSVKRR